MSICGFPTEKALEIYQRFPASIKVLHSFLNDQAKSGYSDADIQVLEEMLAGIPDLSLFTLVTDARKLYDFFDIMNIYITVQFSDSGTLYTAAVDNGNAQKHIPETRIMDPDLSIRANTELSAFLKAFEILELKLTS